ncbi:MAG: hypothetical protein IIB03_06750, partial [Acidobacteria bacterium]|nr:hypothetical protein [Acidobacteriota bacterium]
LMRFQYRLNPTEDDLRWNFHPWVHLELTLMKLVELSRLPTVEEVIGKLTSGKEISTPDQGQPASTGLLQTAQTASSRGQSAASVKEPAATKSTTPGREESPGEAREPSGEIERTDPSGQDQTMAHLFAAVQHESLGLYSSLQHASRTTFDEGKLSVLFSQAEAFHHQQVSRPDNQERLSKLCAKIVGSEPQVEILLEESVVNQADPTDDPKVKAFIETFPGKVIVEREVDE